MQQSERWNNGRIVGQKSNIKLEDLRKSRHARRFAAFAAEYRLTAISGHWQFFPKANRRDLYPARLYSNFSERRVNW